MKRIALYGLAAALLVLAAVKFIFQDMMRLAYPLNDLTTAWVSTKAFLDGADPYGDIQQFEHIWASTGISASGRYPDYAGILAGSPMAEPPTAMAVLAPLGILRWHTAVWVYTIGSTALFILMIILLTRNLRTFCDARKLYFIAFPLAMAPLHSGIHVANLNTLTVACLCLCVALMSSAPTWSGIALAIAMCLKPPVAILFFAYMWLRRKWQIAFSALAAGAALSAVTITWMAIHRVSWLGGLRGALANLAAPTGINAFATSDVARFQIVNLRILTYQLTQNLEWSAILAWAVFALLAGAAVYLIHRRVSDQNESAGLAIVAALTLLPVYQRYYTATILLLVLYWALENWNTHAKAACALMVPLLFPFVAWIETSGIATRVLNGSNTSFQWVWNDILMPHVIWIELGLLVILLVDTYRRQASLPLSELPVRQ